MVDAPAAAPPPRPWVVLMVDDEPDILQSVKSLLEASIPGIRVITAPSGRIGLELLDRERVDVILSDLRMPGMDGIEFLYQARRAHPNIPRVMLTAFGNEDVARRAVLETFCSAFISKGADPEMLIGDVVKLLSYVPSAALQPAPPPPAPGTQPPVPASASKGRPAA